MQNDPQPEHDGSVPYRLSPEVKRVFIGLMLGMLVASLSQTIVGPALPRIVAELGGMEHYSWVATAAMLVSAITVPIVGKLSDLYGRREFYIGGLVVFMLGSIISGVAQNFWVLVAGRAVQGIGMGTLMPLSQTIIGDLIPARQRGKYQGLMGAVFGVTSVAGPLAGGFITDHLGWRWLFFATLPVGVIALLAIMRFLRLDHTPRKVEIDRAGILTLSLALIAILLATSWGGTSFPWVSPQVLGLFGVGAVLLAVFAVIEARASEPVIPLRLFRNPTFTLSNIAGFFVSMVMFGLIIYIPVFAQGVLGVNATNSGLILVPLMLGMILMGIVAGFLITKTGRYKELMLVGVGVLGIGCWLLTRLGAHSSATALTVAMVFVGIGLGLVMQQYTLLVQNAATRKDLGVATASTQFFRNVGSTVGIAVFGTVMSSGLAEAIGRHLPPGSPSAAGQGLNAGAVLDPTVLSKLPGPVAAAVREGLAERLHDVFMLSLPVVVLILLATLAIPVIPLRDTLHSQEDAQREFLDTVSSSTHDSRELVPGFGSRDVGARTRERVLGIQLTVMINQVRNDEPRPLLTQAVTDLGDGDLERGLALLERTALMLMTEDSGTAADVEKYAAAVADRVKKSGGLMAPSLRQEIAVTAAALEDGDDAERERVLTTVEPSVAERNSAVDVTQLFTAASELSAALLVDISASLRARSLQVPPLSAVLLQAGAAPTGQVPDASTTDPEEDPADVAGLDVGPDETGSPKAGPGTD